MTPRKMAAILGRFWSLLPTMPALHAFTDLLVQFVRRVDDVGWDTPCVVPIELKNQVHAITGLLHSWPGRKFVTSNQQPHKHLASDATLFAWGDLNVQDPRQMVHYLAFHRAHQRQGINSGGKHHTIASQTQRNSGFGCGQRHRLFLFNKSRRQGSTVEQPSKTISHLVDNSSHRIACSARTVTPDVSRPNLSLVIRPKRIFSQPSHLQTYSRQVQKVLQAEHRYVRFSEQCLAAPLLCQVAASPSDPHRRFGMPT